mmetsp:Transcript_102497/g.161952  ORF Transcript_102497/g.161952 Transcript_102497/m.161952 type:complete len:209 (-) Transcript_102497:1026-1652(-)
MPLRMCSLCNTSRRLLIAKLANWPASTRSTPTRLLWMPVTRTSMNLPTLSGPSNMSAFVATMPETRLPCTTVPMPGTWNRSAICTTLPESFSQVRLAGTWLRNKRTKSRDSPETAEVRNIGVIVLPAIVRHAVSTSASLRTTNGIFCTPCCFNSFFTSSSVDCTSSSEAVSTLVSVTKNGIFKASTLVRCSLVVPRMPPRFASMTIIA